jgi:hypothetical protein
MRCASGAPGSWGVSGEEWNPPSALWRADEGNVGARKAVQRAAAGRRAAYHFSVDDVFEALIETSDRGIDLFAHPFFAYLREIHDRYRTNIDLYLFLLGPVNSVYRSLAEVSDRNRQQFQEATWLRLGPHALAPGIPPFSQRPAEQRRTFDRIYDEIDRFAGPNKTCRWLRLHYFSEAYELSAYFRRRGVDALLLTDKEATAYRLPDSARAQLRRVGRATYRKLDFLRSHVRIEKLAPDTPHAAALGQRIDRVVAECGYLSLFTHEVELGCTKVREQTEQCLRHVALRGMRSL